MGWDGMDSWRWCASDSDSKTMNEEQRLRANVVVRWNVCIVSIKPSIYQSIDWKLPRDPIWTAIYINKHFLRSRRGRSRDGGGCCVASSCFWSWVSGCSTTQSLGS